VHGNSPDNSWRRTIPGLILVLATAIAGGGALSAQGDQPAQAGASGLEDRQQAPPPQSGAPGSQSGRSAGRAGESQRTTPPGIRPEWEWWKDAEFKQQAGLSDPVAKRIDDIYQNRLRLMRPFAEQMVRESAVLDRMARERVATVEEFQLQAQRVESLFSRLRESRHVMIYRLSKELTPEQYQKLLQAKEARDRRRQGRGPAPRR
jgi:hypothetical protein